MHIQPGRHGGLDGFQEAAKLNRTMAPMKLADHGPSLDIERDEEGGSAMSHLVVSAAFGLSRTRACNPEFDAPGLNV